VESDGRGGAGLVLGGGGARGAYASGALSVLLRELKDEVRVIVGTSAGALISAYLAANGIALLRRRSRTGCGSGASCGLGACSLR
jgi:predicted acylesterase/phospholipase RssA